MSVGGRAFEERVRLREGLQPSSEGCRALLQVVTSLADTGCNGAPWLRPSRTAPSRKEDRRGNDSLSAIAQPRSRTVSVEYVALRPIAVRQLRNSPRFFRSFPPCLLTTPFVASLAPGDQWLPTPARPPHEGPIQATSLWVVTAGLELTHWRRSGFDRPPGQGNFSSCGNDGRCAEQMLGGGTVKQMYELAGGGQSIRGIARSLGISRNTVRKYLRSPQVPTPRPRPGRVSKPDPYKPYIRGGVPSVVTVLWWSSPTQRTRDSLRGRGDGKNSGVTPRKAKKWTTAGLGSYPQGKGAPTRAKLLPQRSTTKPYGRPPSF